MNQINRCVKCSMDKPAAEFYLDGRNKSGLHSWCKACVLARNALRRITHPDYGRNENLRRYGLSIKLYDDMMMKQNYCCASCGRNQSEFDTKFAVDHDHKCCPGRGSCGKCIRGLLCNSCNWILGYAEDSIDRLMAMAAYLMKFEDILVMEMN